MPPVSAIKGASGERQLAMFLFIERAVEVDPVKHTPAMFILDTNFFPTISPLPSNS